MMPIDCERSSFASSASRFVNISNEMRLNPDSAQGIVFILSVSFCLTRIEPNFDF